MTTRRANGLECLVTDYKLESPPPLGSIIRVKHHGTTSTGILRGPTFWQLII